MLLFLPGVGGAARMLNSGPSSGRPHGYSVKSFSLIQNTGTRGLEDPSPPPWEGSGNLLDPEFPVEEGPQGRGQSGRLGMGHQLQKPEFTCWPGRKQTYKWETGLGGNRPTGS